MSVRCPDRPFLLDVSRLVWRVWLGNLPTGIDRVCLAYLEHFRGRSQAVVQRWGLYFVLSPSDSDRLFDVLVSKGTHQRLKLLKLAAAAGARAIRTRPRSGSVYLNVGHTGLDQYSLPKWISKNHLRAVYLIHDLIPLTHPQYCRPGEEEKHTRRMSNVLISAAGVIGNSQATMNDLESFAAEQGKAIPPSTIAWISGTGFRAGVPPKQASRPHFITVGTIEGRKNHQLLLDLWGRLVADAGEGAPILLIVGQRGWQADRVFQQLDDLGDLQDHVRELNECDDAELASWIAGARALLMPSYAEGFGLPVFEALELGTRVIAADLPVYREIAGDIPTYLDPDDVGAWQQMVTELCRDSSRQRGQTPHVSAFRGPSWKDHFQKVENWLTKL
jgi:glycosyltransferase involved in cell wall biosynthesis